MADCPDKQRLRQQQQENAHVSYYQTGGVSQYDEEEMQDKGVLDTGAVATICGRRWFNRYMDRCRPHLKRTVEFQECRETFRFGDGRVFACERTTMLPVSFCGVETWIKVYLVDKPVPLLLSLEAMTGMRLMLDIPGRKLSAYGREDRITYTSTGHMAMKIFNPEIEYTHGR